ncbi:amino acid transporter [Corynebacterium yudongzhengii]|uniref:Alanine:cation symporter family protein n=1 Tax=Corynebacterium yudongzhengii TaxID=2080740 RepID=A0A2U1T6Y6_9CORY|nr:amino acid carrier protein [Corynebacterium yudongzhengii]AWB81292.1 amino acid transporter [Corynebacterium yudongzhengii]PWC01735.1 alanine:cation symporter family protein [Corynebacterium yudongzhengii]
MDQIDQLIESGLGPVADILDAIVFFELPIAGGIPLIVIWLMAAAIFLTVWLGFQPITGIKHSFNVIRGKFNRKTDPGEISTFQALAPELSGTIGLGNIAGVAVAISVGGPGAALWIVVFGLIGMSVKMSEATLGVMFRKVRDDGTIAGGPMYYLRDGLRKVGWVKTGSVLAWLYALFTLLGLYGADLFQSNQVAEIVSESSGSEFLQQNNWVIGIVIATLVGIVIIGGVKSIGKWTGRITPAMAAIYMISVTAVSIVNINDVPAALASMVTGMITPEGVTGGVIGVAVVGIQRALFSNAAGVGTAGFAHSASKTRRPATEGFTAMWGPFFDSVIVCMLTATAIVVTGVYEGAGEDVEGVALTASAFGTVAGWFPYLLTVCVALFGFSTVLAYSYYFEQAATYIFGHSDGVRWTVKVIWVIGPIIGASASLDAAITFADASFFLMAIPNLLGIYFLSNVLRREILSYRKSLSRGQITAIPDEDLQVGMGNHEPTAEQVEHAEAVERGEREPDTGPQEVDPDELVKR